MYPGILYLDDELNAHPDGLQSRQAITGNEKQPFCFRCGNNTPRLFGKTFRGDLYCRNCLMMKRVEKSACLHYLKAKESERIFLNEALKWDGELSRAQKKGSDAVVSAVERLEPLLLWAVAGSGKTEMTFRGLEAAFERGLRVCFASPRVDVCIELLPRFREVFPDVPLVCLYGDSEDKFQGECFVIATTHQLIRFYRYFDVLFIDEVDAFPYAKDPFLEYAVRKARAEKGTEIYITATPEKAWQDECEKGTRRHVKIPARYHGYKLPVPELIWIGDWAKLLKKKQICRKVLDWLRKHQQNDKPILLFFPKIEVMYEVKVALEQAGYLNVETVHSADKLRKEKVERFRKRETAILLSTTILERGVTFADVQVAVFGSEGAIFTEAALVQIAGRAGRKVSSPTGEVFFFHHGRTREMKRAIKHIKMMNALGVKEGLLSE
ncbi:DEAD/DEAH box helicase [Listeria kieliensis]